jgi:hypothetical protein
VLASEQDRPDVARRWAQWKAHQSRVESARLVFIDETWTRANDMSRSLAAFDQDSTLVVVVDDAAS